MLSTGKAKVELHIAGMTCAACVATLQNHLEKVAGVSSPSVNLISERASLVLDMSKMNLDGLRDEIDDLGFEASVLSFQELKEHPDTLSPPTSLTRLDSRQTDSVYATTPPQSAGGGLTSLSTTGSMTPATPLHARPTARPDPRAFTSRSESTATLSLRISSNMAMLKRQTWCACIWDAVFFQSGTVRTSSIARDVNCASQAIQRLNGVLSCVASASAATITLVITYNPHVVGARTLLELAVAELPGCLVIPTTSDQIQEKLYSEYTRARALFLKCVIPTVIVATMAMAPHHRLPQVLQSFVMPGLSVCALLMFILTTPIHIFGGWEFHVRAWKALRNCYATMDLLVSLSTNLTYFYSVASIIYSIVLAMSYRDTVLGAGILVAEHGSMLHEEGEGPLSMTMMVVPHFFETPAVLITSLLLGKVLSSRAVHRLQDVRNERCVVLQQKDSQKRSTIELADEDTALLAGSAKPARRFFDTYCRGVELSMSLLHIGDVVLLNPSVVAPTDGVVEHCSTTLFVDESVATGESHPIAKNKGDYVIGGSKVISGTLYLRVTEIGSETFLGQVQSLVDSANASRSRAQVVADRVSRWFVPAVLIVALLTALVWSLLVSFTQLGSGSRLSRAVFVSQFAVAVIAVACPCALGLATPTAVALATGCAAKFGILIKNLGIMEEASQRITDVVFDKTGTLTTGHMRLLSVSLASVSTWPQALSWGRSSRLKWKPDWARLVAGALYSEGVDLQTWDAAAAAAATASYPHGQPPSLDEVGGFLLWTAASAQLQSNHPVGRALVDFYCRHLRSTTGITMFPELCDPVDCETIPGEGILGTIDFSAWAAAFVTPPSEPLRVALGNSKLMERLRVALPFCTTTPRGATAIYVAIANVLVGVLGLGDQPKPDAAKVVTALRKNYGASVWMCTGDAEPAALHVAQRVGIPFENVRYEAKPEDKGDFVRFITQLPLPHGSHTRRRRVVMIGDGMNDAPSLAAATVGVAIGARTHLTVAAADVILVESSLSDFLGFMELSKQTVRVTRTNYIWAIVFNALGLPVAAGVFYPRVMLPPAIAGCLMALSSIVVVMNSLRLTFFKPSRCPESRSPSFSRQIDYMPLQEGTEMQFCDKP